MNIRRILLLPPLLAALAAGTSRGDDPYGISQWPPDAEFTALTNHIQACYSALALRFQVAGRTDLPDAPSYVFPYDDYLRMGQAVDRLCGSFIVQTNADANGSFDAWLAAHPASTNNLPRWTPDTLHTFCGFTNWGNDPILTSWAVCDRSIQTQMVQAIQALCVTVAGASPRASAASPNALVWEGWGAGSGTTVSTNATAGNGGWPYAMEESSTTTLNWNASCPYTKDVTATDGSYEPISLSPSAWPGPAGVKPWKYLLQTTLLADSWADPANGSLWHLCEQYGLDIVTPQQRPPPSGALIDSAQPGPFSGLPLSGIAVMVAPGFGQPTANTYASCFHYYQGYWSHNVHANLLVQSLTGAQPYNRAERLAGLVGMTGSCATNAVAMRSLYLLGVPPPFFRSPREGCQWQTELNGLCTNSFKRLFSETSSATNSTYSGGDLSAQPFAGQSVDQSGWAVGAGFWVLDWQFPSVPLPDSSAPALLPPDTDLDGIIHLLKGPYDHLEPYGSMSFLPDWDKPYLRLPLASAKAQGADLAVSVELNAGRGEVLPYRYVSRNDPSLLYSWCRWGMSQGAGIYLNTDTHVVESGSITNSGRKVKRVSVLRPHGRLVAFDFPWTNSAFSTVGYPMGPDAGRSYVLEDTMQDPNDENACFRLRFQDGIYHEFPYFYSAYMAIGRIKGGRTTVVPRTWLANIAPLYQGMVVWQTKSGAFPHLSSVSQEDGYWLSDRYLYTTANATVAFDGIRPRQVSYSQNGTNYLTVDVLFDGTGRASGLNKSGVGAEAASVCADIDAGTIAHGWGIEYLQQYAAVPGGTTCAVGYSSPSFSWDLSHSLDANQRPLERTLQQGTSAARSQWRYETASGRTASQVPQAALTASYVPPLGAPFSFAHDLSRGWLTSATVDWRGLATVVAADYADPHGGDAADPANLLEYPRTRDVLADGSILRRELTAVGRSPDWGDGSLQLELRVPAAADTPWDTASLFRKTDAILENYIGGWSFWNYDYGANGIATSATAGGTAWYSWTSFGTGWNNDYSSQFVFDNILGYPISMEAGIFDGQSGYYTNLVVTGTDSAGRPTASTWFDATTEAFSDYCLWGPQSITRRDRTTAQIQYDAFGRPHVVTEPELQRVTTIDADPLGLHVTKTVAQGGVARVYELERDLFGRPLRYADPLGTNTWTYTPTADGWTAVITRTGLGDVTEERYFDGALKAVYGPGAQHCASYTWSVSNSQLVQTVTALTPTGTPTPEQTFIAYNAVGLPAAIRKAGVANPFTIEYDGALRPWRYTNPAGKVCLLNHDQVIGIEKAAVKMGGSPDSVELAGTDIANRFTWSIDENGQTTSNLAYAVNGSDAETALAGSYQSHDGRNAAFTFNGRSATLASSAFTGPRTFTSDAMLPGKGQAHASFGPLGLEAMTLFDSLSSTNTWSTFNLSPDLTSLHIDGSSGSLDQDFDVAGLLHTSTQAAPGGVQTGISYLPGTSLPSSITAGSDWQTLTYWPNGLPHCIRNSGQPDAELEWDSQARLKAFTITRNGQQVITTWERDQQTGWLACKKVNGQIVEAYAWYDDGQLRLVTKGGSSTLANTYSPAGNLSSTVDSATNCTAETITRYYNRLGQETNLAVAGGLSVNYSPDLDGTVRNEAVTGSGLVKSHTLTRQVDTESGRTVGLTANLADRCRTMAANYSSASLVTNITDASLSANYTWRAGGFPSGFTMLANGSPSIALSNDWNSALGTRTNIAWSIPGGTFSFAYVIPPGSNRIASIVREDGSRREIDYTASGQLKAWTFKRSDGTTDPTRSYAYDYDEAGNVLQGGRVDTTGHGRDSFTADDFNFHAVRTWSAVDLVGQAATNAVVTANGIPAVRDGTRFVVSIPLAPTATVATVLIGAVVSTGSNTENVASQTVTLNLPASTETIQTSLAGNTVSDSLVEYLYDARNQLRRVTDKIGSPRIQSIYDYYPDGRRARKTVSVWTNGTWQVARSHQFIYDNWNLLEEVVSNQTTVATRDYLWGLDLAGMRDGQGDQKAGGVGGLLAITESTGSSTNILLPVADHVGTIHALIAVTTNSVPCVPFVAAAYEYTPIGDLVSADGAYAASCPFGFMTRYRDSETALLYFGLRYYDPRSFKFLTTDPIGEAGGLNTTAFCNSDPVNCFDALGMDGNVLSIYMPQLGLGIQDFSGSASWLAPSEVTGNMLLSSLDTASAVGGLILPRPDLTYSLGRTEATSALRADATAVDKFFGWIGASACAVLTVSDCLPVVNAGENLLVKAATAARTKTAEAVAERTLQKTGSAIINPAASASSAPLNPTDPKLAEAIKAEIQRIARQHGPTYENPLFVGNVRASIEQMMRPAAAESTAVRNPNVYEAIFESPINGTTRAAHRASANDFLAGQLKADSQLNGSFNELFGQNVLEHMESGSSGLLNPPRAVWHHPFENPNVMQLLRSSEHTSPTLQSILHPDGIGGFGNFYAP